MYESVSNNDYNEEEYNIESFVSNISLIEEPIREKHITRNERRKDS